MKAPAEPLALSAPIAWRLAPGLCSRDRATGESCSWNHRLWQVLRMMGLVTTPEHHAEVFLRAVEIVTARRGAPRILVSGAADYGMLAWMLAAFGERGVVPETLVLDLCETPLMLNRWYAERAGNAISTCRSDILEYADARGFDLLCTHSFLGRFSPAERPRLLARWRELLDPGGIVVTVNRLRPAAGPGLLGFTSEQASAFRDTVMKGAKALPGSLGIDLSELAREAERYTRLNRVHAVRSGEEVRALFESSGFAIEQLSCEPAARAAPTASTAPTVLGGAEYVRVIARRT